MSYAAAMLGDDTAAAAVATRAALQKARAKPVVQQTATSLQYLATAAEALRRLPGGGALADTMLRSLNVAVNKGGKIKQKNGKLYASRPPESAQPKVGAAWLVSVAPWAMRAAAGAAQAAKLGLQRFGGSMVANLRTAGSYAASKAASLIARAKDSPAFAKVASIAGKALTAASVLLGIQSVAKVVAPATAKAADEAAAAAVRKVRRGASRGATATARAVQAIPAAAEKAADGVSTGLKWGAAVVAALALAKLFL